MFRIVSAIAVVGTVAAVAAHYLFFGPKHPEVAKEKRDVRRFTLWERFVHGVTLLSFLVLAATGLLAAIGYGGPLRGWLWLVHVAVAPVFALGVTAMTLVWGDLCLFESLDWEWAKSLGGYLGGDKKLPAGWLNGGQKAYLWAIAAIGLVAILSGLGRIFPVLNANGQTALYELHRYSTLFLVVATIAHLYLGTLASPGTFWAMVTGRVSSTWAEHHHPNWWERISKGGADEGQ